VRSKPDKPDNVIVQLLINQKQIWLNMAFAMAVPFAGQSMI